MVYKLKDILSYSQNAPKYQEGLSFVQSGADEKDFSSLNMWLRRYCEKNENLSFMIVHSSFDTKEGVAAVPHIHGLLVSDKDKTIDEAKKSLTKYCQKRRKKRPNLKRQQMKPLEGMNIVSYMKQQADSERTYGSFDFSFFTDARYVDMF